MPAACGHALCDLIGGACSITAGRSRGCTPGLAEKSIAPEVFDEIRALLPRIDHEPADRAAAVRLAEIIRREARDDRNVVLHARADEPDLAHALERLCLRR